MSEIVFKIILRDNKQKKVEDYCPIPQNQNLTSSSGNDTKQPRVE